MTTQQRIVETLSRIESELEDHRKMIEELRTFILKYAKAIEDSNGRFTSLERELYKTRERLSILEARDKIYTWVVSVIAGMGSGFLIWGLNRLVG